VREVWMDGSWLSGAPTANDWRGNSRSFERRRGDECTRR
jgi:hypothetical protein